MKKIIIALFIILLIVPVSYSQVKKSQENQQFRKMNFENDALFKKLKLVIPENWLTSYNRNKLIIERKEPVWILFENKINAPVNTEFQSVKIKRIKKYGQFTKSKLVFRAEDKWTDARIKQANQQNNLIQTKILDLLKKYDLARLYDKSLSRKGWEYYQSTFPEKKKRIDGYLKEKTELEKKIIKLPDYHTENFSLFLIEQIGQEDEFHTIYPESASTEIFFIKNKLNEILEISQ